MRHYDEIDPDEIVKDGETIRCPLFLMDGLQRAVASIDLSDHRAGYRFNDDSRDGRRAVYEEYCARLRDAWKSGKRDDDDDNNDDNENDDPTLSTHRRALS